MPRLEGSVLTVSFPTVIYPLPPRDRGPRRQTPISGGGSRPDLAVFPARRAYGGLPFRPSWSRLCSTLLPSGLVHERPVGRLDLHHRELGVDLQSRTGLSEVRMSPM